MNIEKIDKIIQYALAIASREDFYNRELGPIHLIKYVYLADLAYAEKNDGKTYTELKWKFHNFGPWAVDAFKRLEPACKAVGASEKRIASEYRDDFTRWYLADETLIVSLEKELPFTITSAVKRAVHAHGADTNGLLHHVYHTTPMLRAAPGEFLDFSLPTIIDCKTVVQEPSPMTIKEQKRRRAELTEARSRIQQKFVQKRKGSRKIASVRQPRYDAVFESGCQWLDSLAGPEIKQLKGEAEFSPDMWKSKTRFDPELS